MKVILYRTNSLHGQPEQIATVASGTPRPITTGEPDAFNLTVVDPADPGRRLTPADGDAWIGALPYNIRGSYVRAVLTEGVDPYAVQSPARA